MSTIPLRADAFLIAQMLRLDPLGAEIAGCRFDAVAGQVVFDVAVPDAPEGATAMRPVYQREYPSGRSIMIDPGYVVPCQRCKGRGFVPDWPKGLNEEFGEPMPKPCPVCTVAP